MLVDILDVENASYLAVYILPISLSPLQTLVYNMDLIMLL